jgi:hypothetical protein
LAAELEDKTLDFNTKIKERDENLYEMSIANIKC